VCCPRILAFQCRVVQIDRILNDVDFNQFKNSKSKIAKLFKSEEELFNEAMKSEIEARRNYEEYKKEI